MGKGAVTCLPPAFCAAASFFSASLTSLARCLAFISAAFWSVWSALFAELRSDSCACMFLAPSPLACELRPISASYWARSACSDSALSSLARVAFSAALAAFA